MTEAPEPATLAEQAAELGRNVTELSAAVYALRVSNRRMRAIVRVLAVVVAVVVVSAVAVGFVAADSRQASRRAEEAVSLAHRNAENQRLSCLVGNEARATSLQLWTYFLDAAGKQPLTPPQRRQLMQLRVHVAQTYAPRDCDSTPAPTSTPTR